MQIDLLAGAYKQRFGQLNSSQLINWYMHYATPAEKDKSPKSLFPTPGLKEFADLGAHPVRGIFSTKERCFAVAGSSFYEISLGGTTTNHGTLTNSQGHTNPVEFTMDGNGLLSINDYDEGYTFDTTTDTLAAITDVDYPTNFTAEYVDGYTILAGADGRVYFSEINDATDWRGDSVFTPTSEADKTICVRVLNEYLYCFGYKTIETYLNDGTTPFIRQPGSSRYFGAISPYAINKYRDGIIFLGRANNGEAQVNMITSNGEILTISPPSITWQLNEDIIELSDAYSYIQYTKDGHTWYYLTIPQKDITFVYDIITKEWHQRASFNPLENEEGMFRGRHFTNFSGKNLFTDVYSGKVFLEDYETYTEDDQTIKRIINTPIATQDYKHMIIHNLQIDVNTGEAATTTGQGSEPRLMFSLSKDGGKTYLNSRFVTLPTKGNYSNRVRINKIGSGRHLTARIELSDPIPLAIFGMSAAGSIGLH